MNYVTVEHKDYLAPFNYDKCPKSKVEKNVKELLEEIANITMYTKALRQMGIDVDTLPISNLNKDSITQAKDVLKQLTKVIDDSNFISSKGLRANLEDLTAVREKMIELSNQYYELIPNSSYKNQIAPPLSNHNQVKNCYDALEQISNIEKASKILLGALHKQQEKNPIDYIHEALNVKLDHLAEKDPEYEAIEKYVKNTANINFDTHQLKVFKIEREGEEERMDQFQNIANHRLLFHGSSIFNFIGLLSQGLKIAPPEAPTTGYMFGKGIYLADMFSKSFTYSNSRFTGQDSTLLLVCEAALGNIKKLYQSQNVEKLEKKFNSVVGKGKSGPDYDSSLILPDATELPSGPIVEYKDGEAKTAFNPNGTFYLQQNEFVIYNTDQVRMRYLLQICKKEKEAEKK